MTDFDALVSRFSAMAQPPTRCRVLRIVACERVEAAKTPVSNKTAAADRASARPSHAGVVTTPLRGDAKTIATESLQTAPSPARDTNATNGATPVISSARSLRARVVRDRCVGAATCSLTSPAPQVCSDAANQRPHRLSCSGPCRSERHRRDIGWIHSAGAGRGASGWLSACARANASSWLHSRSTRKSVSKLSSPTPKRRA